MCSGSGSGMKALTLPSFALPILIPRSHPPDASWCYSRRLRVGDVDVVVLVDEHAARTAELEPLIDELAVLVEISMRLLPRLATNSRPRESIASECGMFSSPGVVEAAPLGLPHFHQKFSGLVELVDDAAAGAVDLDTKMSPFGANSTSFG